MEILTIKIFVYLYGIKWKRFFIGIDNEPSYIEYAKGRIYNAKEGEPVNYLVGNSKHLSENKKHRIFIFDKKQRDNYQTIVV